MQLNIRELSGIIFEFDPENPNAVVPLNQGERAAAVRLLVGALALFETMALSS